MSKFAKGLRQGLQEALDFADGKTNLKSEYFKIPEPSVECKVIADKGFYRLTISSQRKSLR